MKRPNRKLGRFCTLPIAGHTVAVHWVKDLIEREECAGIWRPDKRRISMDASLSQAEAQETLIHECAHASSDTRDLGLTEDQVRNLALDLQQMLAPFLKVIR